MKITVYPSKLHGKLTLIASKSELHRILICNAIANSTTEIDTQNNNSVDIETTKKVLDDLFGQKNLLNCKESGSTLRFLLPLACTFEREIKFVGEGRLPSRPISELANALRENGANIVEDGIATTNGGLKSGKFYLSGGTSSQFASGLMFALPLLGGDSQIVFTSKLQSKSYVDITIDILKKFGVEIKETTEGYFIKGNQKFVQPKKISAGGDWSNGAFFLAANFFGSSVEIENLDNNSKQGDRAILDIIYQFSTSKADLSIDVSDIPDLVPIISVMATQNKFDTVLTNAERLRIKESDRLHSTAELLKACGARTEISRDSIKIFGNQSIHGAEIDSFNDHRIVMSAAILALKSSSPITIENAEAVNKSYPDFFRQFELLGGTITCLH